MTLNDLIGKHVLDAVDFESDKDPANAIRFRLDGVLYVATEDESDGYRSSLRDIAVSESPTSNTFEPIEVLAAMSDGYDEDVLKIIDTKTGKTVIEVGTTSASDYYPSFVFNFHPENMAINALA